MYEYAVTPTLTTVVENDDRTVTVLGTGFVPGEKVYCDLGSGNGYVEGTVQDEHTILCATGLGGAAVVAGNITVNDEDGNSVLTPLSTDASEVSTIALAPTSIDKVTPTGPRSGGTTVVVHGENFTPTALCRFGTSPPVAAAFVSSKQIVCESPSHKSDGGVTLEVSNDGYDWTSAGYVFAYQTPASLSSVTPRQGSITGGSLLRLSGVEHDEHGRFVVPSRDDISHRVEVALRDDDVVPSSRAQRRFGPARVTNARRGPFHVRRVLRLHSAAEHFVRVPY